MITGRSRVRAASLIATSGPGSCSAAARKSFANDTSRMLFEVAIPTAMIAPMNDSTLSVVPVIASIQRIPTIAPGTARMMMSGSDQDWNSTASRRYTRATARTRPSPSRPNAANMLSL